MKEDKKDDNSEKRSRKRKILISSIALLTGVSATVVGSSLIAYNSLFSRYERPDYALKAGNYCYERVRGRLYREEFYFPSDKELLKGYYYPSGNSKGLVVVAHGFHAGADDFIPIIEYLVKNKFSVFTYDLTGTYDSKGDGTVGWCQSLVDIDYALRYVSSNAPYNLQPCFLLGHSWGGYAVTSVLAIHKNVKACAGIAPMNNGSTIMVEKGCQYVGNFAKLPKPVIDIYQKKLFGDYVRYNGVKGINSTSIPVLIAQGVEDKVITYDKQSVIAHRSEITNPNVVYYETEGLQGGHESILNSVNALIYQSEVNGKLLKLKSDLGRKLTYEEQVEFYKTVNHDLYSEVNYELMDKIIETFNSVL